jgi:hypothetical protein
VGKGILNRGTQVHKSKAKYNRNQKMTLLEIEEEIDDQENIRRLIRETQVPKKLQNKLERQATEKGLEGNQVDKYIEKVERQMNRRKSD